MQFSTGPAMSQTGLGAVVARVGELARRALLEGAPRSRARRHRARQRPSICASAASNRSGMRWRSARRSSA